MDGEGGGFIFTYSLSLETKLLTPRSRGPSSKLPIKPKDRETERKVQPKVSSEQAANGSTPAAILVTPIHPQK